MQFAGSFGLTAFILALLSSSPAQGAESVTQTQDGPFEVSFSWQAGSSSSAIFTVDGARRATLNGTNEGAGAKKLVVTNRSAGPHILKWEWTDTAVNRLTDVVVRPFGEAGTVSASLELTNADVSIQGDAVAGDSAAVGETSDGVDAVRFGAAVARLWLDGPARVGWKWRQSNPGSEVMTRRSGSIPQTSPAGGFPRLRTEGQWITESTLTSAVGSHYFEWQFSGASSGKTWLGAVSVTAVGVPTLGDWLDDGSLAWTASPTASWQTVTLLDNQTVAAYDATAVRCLPPFVSPSPTLVAEIAQPGFLWVLGLGATPQTTMNGVTRTVPSSSAQWRRIPAGAPAIALGVTSSSSSSFVGFGTARFMPEVDFRAATETAVLPGWTWTNLPPDFVGAQSTWVPWTGDSVGVTPPLSAVPVMATATVTGPVVVVFRATAVENTSSGVISVDGVRVTDFKLSHNDSAWTTLSFHVPDGVHTADFAFTATPGTREPRLLLDGFQMMSLSTSPADFSAALDFPSVFHTSTASQFRVESAVDAFNGARVKSPRLKISDAASFDVAVTGPGVLGFDWSSTQFGTPTNYTVLHVLVGDQRLELPSRQSEMTTWLRLNASGPQTVRFVVPPQFTEAADREVAVDHLRFHQDAESNASLSTALDAPFSTFLPSNPARPWRAVPSGSNGGAAYTWLGAESTLALAPAVPGVLSYRQMRQPGGLAFTAGVAETVTSAAAETWTTQGRELWPVHLPFSFPAAAGGPSSTAWLDDVTFVPAVSVDLATATDAPQLMWRTGGSAGPWRGWSGIASGATGEHAAYSARVNAGQTSWIETSFVGPASVQFRVNIPQGESSVLVDASPTLLLGSTFSWDARSIQVGSPGLHTVRWSLAVSPNTVTLGLGAALDAVSISADGGTFGAWVTAAGISGVDAGAGADPDGDGQSNLWEYVLGSSPASATSRADFALAPSIVTLSGEPFMQLSWTMSASAAVSVEVQWLRDDGGTAVWESADVELTSSAANGGKIDVKALSRTALRGSEVWRVRFSPL